MLQKKIAFIIPSLVMGGMERVMSEIVNYFASNNLASEVHLIILTRNDIAYKIHKDVKIHEPNFNYKDYSKLVYSLKSVWYLRKTLKKYKIDSALSFGDRYNSLVILGALWLSTKVFVSNRMSPTLSNGKVIDFLNKCSYRFANGIIAQTEIARNIFLKRYGNKNVFVIANPIKLVPTDNKNLSQRENIILNVGRFVEGKNQQLLIQYFQKMNLKNWKLIFLGDGPQLHETKEYVLNEGLEKNIEFHGNVKNIDDYYRRSKVFAFTSSTEGFPNVLGEAMSSKLACISFDCITGPSELIDDGLNGFLTPVFDEGNYLKKLHILLKDEDKRKKMGDAAFEKVQSFTIEKIGAKYYKTFAQN